MKSLLFLAAAVFVFSCNNEYGNKVSINKTSEVYYKGKGVTEADAKRLGDYLLKEGYFDSTTAKSVQLTKDSAWVVKFVVDKDKLDPSDAALRLSLRFLEMMISEQVFNKEKTRLVLADQTMEEIRDTIGATNDTTTAAQ